MRALSSNLIKPVKRGLHVTGALPKIRNARGKKSFLIIATFSKYYPEILTFVDESLEEWSRVALY